MNVPGHLDVKRWISFLKRVPGVRCVNITGPWRWLIYMKYYKYVKLLTRCELTRDPRVSFVSVTLCSASTFVLRPGLLPCLVSGVRNHHHHDLDHHPDELWSTHDKMSNIQPRMPALWLMSWVSTVLRNWDFIHRANTISVVLTLQKLTQIFQLICGLDIWVTIKLPLCPSLWSPAVPCRRLLHAVIFSSVVTCNFLQQFIAQIAAAGKKLNMYTYWATFLFS